MHHKREREEKKRGGGREKLRSERGAKTFGSNLRSFLLCRKLSPPGYVRLCWDGTGVAWA